MARLSCWPWVTTLTGSWGAVSRRMTMTRSGQGVWSLDSGRVMAMFLGGHSPPSSDKHQGIGWYQSERCYPLLPQPPLPHRFRSHHRHHHHHHRRRHHRHHQFIFATNIATICPFLVGVVVLLIVCRVAENRASQRALRREGTLFLMRLSGVCPLRTACF